MLGILVVHKQQGITSHDAVNAARRKLGTRRVGHSGTLDPMATGVLVLAVGAATRFLQYLPLEPKVYEGEITFGASTDTLDAEGEIVKTCAVPRNLRDLILLERIQFLGQIQQVPPMFSAIKQNGQPLYALAREGKEVVREPRTVFIDSFDLSEFGEQTAQFRVVCSGGTYVRTLANDLGEAVGCGAHLSALRRTSVGSFTLDDAVSLEDIVPDRLIPLRSALRGIPMVELNGLEVRRVRDGNYITAPYPVAGRFAALLDEQGDVFSMARVQENRLQPDCVIPRELLHGPL